MRYLREVALRFESKSPVDLNLMTQEIETLVAKELQRYSIEVKITKNGFYPDESKNGLSQYC